MITQTTDKQIAYLKGVGPQRAETLQKELGIFFYADLLSHFPFRYIDKSTFQSIHQAQQSVEYVQIKGVLTHLELLGEGRRKRLTATLKDNTGEIELVWFQGINWVQNKLKIGVEYVVYGKPAEFKGYVSIPHPDIETLVEAQALKHSAFKPVYNSTEKLKLKGLDYKGLHTLIQNVFLENNYSYFEETLPDYILQQFKLINKLEAYKCIHFPVTEQHIIEAKRRLKFEELFWAQLLILQQKQNRLIKNTGLIFDKKNNLFTEFYKNHLSFELTDAQKKVLKTIWTDVRTGKQMNRLIQGDVGSGKTIVGLLAILMAIDNNYQTCLMAPTEILAQQHYTGIKTMLEPLGLNVAFLSGSIKGKARKLIFENLENGTIHLIIGTHALLEDKVIFKNLGLALIDEQHRFGVAQRAKLWKKNTKAPHVLVMTATPIPRTLAMTVYGDLDISVIDQMPQGRKPIITTHKYEGSRMAIYGFMKEQIALGRQVYVVFPLIEESEVMDYQNLMTGYDNICHTFAKPQYQVSVVHGRMTAADKEGEMQKFVRSETQIMVATTVIEVGVNVPNASLMIIESAERFGLSQLHQLRGRVGRGSDQSFCVLMTGDKLSADSRKRMKTMVQTNDGFVISEVDLELRGPGDINGTQQSGALNFKIANLLADQAILQAARDMVLKIYAEDDTLSLPKNVLLKQYIDTQLSKNKVWSAIS